MNSRRLTGFEFQYKSLNFPHHVLITHDGTMSVNPSVVRNRSRPQSLTDKPLGYDRWWISLNSFGIFLGIMPGSTSEVRKLGEVAVWKGPDPAILSILPASCSLDSFENRMSGLCRALFKKGDSNEVISL